MFFILQEWIPTILADPPQNVIAQSAVGTGKTTAMVIAILSRIDVSKNYPHVLGIVANSEAALQVAALIKTIGRFSKAKFRLFAPNIDCKYSLEKNSFKI